MKTFLFLSLLIILFSCRRESNIESHHKNPNYEKAKQFRIANKSDSAFYYYNLAKSDYTANNDSLGAAKSLVNMAMLQTTSGDFYGSIESSLEANSLLKNEKDSITRSTLAINYNNMAMAFNFLKEYEKAFELFKKALKYVDNKEGQYLCYNNISDVLISQKNIKLAKKYLQNAILAKDSINYSRALNNFAKAKYLDDKNYNPLSELYKALAIRETQQDNWGKNSSYATLSDYFAEKDKIKALFFAEKMLQTASNNRSPDDKKEALLRIIYLDPPNYLKNFQKFNTVSDSIQTARSKAKNQFALIRFDVEKMKTDIAEGRNQLLIKNVLVASLIIMIIIIILLYRKRQTRLRKEKELEIKNTQLTISKKVHDVVANGIYQVMTKIENQENFDKEEALDELEFVYEKSRDISYEKPDHENDKKDYKEKISSLIASFKNENTDTYTVGNEAGIWTDISQYTFDEIYQIARELLVNMKKHSHASRVIFKFEKIDNIIKIQYSDDGIGIPGDMVYKNGLKNTGTRIAAIRGEIIFDNKSEKGLKITISFPAS
ncbi:tetratricopeptide repeat-containing sensor histidine kinase [Chryseobacterium lathyri]|uniref:tetratricopeptide repeat-containing sensor histidine kinase n=1 Tax=Chryseobacterium lathyri TaxID=395933 RepID=UPI001CBE2B21|nr:tetratricopeptide repeat-containing sensor histidine kinase [Chryseobacterium lathyri]